MKNKLHEKHRRLKGLFKMNIALKFIKNRRHSPKKTIERELRPLLVIFIVLVCPDEVSCALYICVGVQYLIQPGVTLHIV